MFSVRFLQGRKKPMAPQTMAGKIHPRPRLLKGSRWMNDRPPIYSLSTVHKLTSSAAPVDS